MTGPARQGPRAASLLEPRHWQLLWLMGTANFFAGYDFNIVIVALPQLRASYHLSQAHASLWIGVIYLGAAPAVLLARRADRRGRRRLLLFSITGYTLATLATAAAPAIGIFVGCQLMARFFLSVEGVLVWTIVAEELPAVRRRPRSDLSEALCSRPSARPRSRRTGRPVPGCRRTARTARS